MLGTPTRMTLVTIGVIIFIAVAGIMAACGDGGDRHHRQHQLQRQRGPYDR